MAKIVLFAICFIFVVSGLQKLAFAENSYSYHVRDFAEKLITFESPPTRIISTAPSITEILFSLGLDKRVVGITNNCNYPPSAMGLPRIGDLRLEVEKIVSLKPDLIVADENLKLESLSQLEKLGFRILNLNCKNIANFKESLMILGRATDREEASKLLLKDMEDRLGEIRMRVSKCNKRVTVFVEIWDKPIISAGGKTLFDDLIQLAGGENVFGAPLTGYPEVNVESLIRKDPQVIVLTTSTKEEVLKKSAWKGLSAIKSDRIYHINPDIIARPTLRMVEALEILALWLHPEIRQKRVNFVGTKRNGPPKHQAKL